MKISAYKGDEGYIFVSYSHKNKKEVLALLRRFRENGIRFYYDEGIEPSKAWAEELARHLKNSIGMVAFITPEYMQSQNCLDELAYCKAENKELLVVYLRETALTDGWKMQLNRKQDIKRWEYRTEDDFIARLLNVEMIAQAGDEAPDEAPEDQAESEEAWEAELLPDVAMTLGSIVNAAAYRLDLKEPEDPALAEKQMQWLRLCGGALATVVGMLLLSALNVDWLISVKDSIGFNWSDENLFMFWVIAVGAQSGVLIAAPQAFLYLKEFPENIYERMRYMLFGVAGWMVLWMGVVLMAEIQFRIVPLWQLMVGIGSILIGGALSRQTKNLLDWGGLFDAKEEVILGWMERALVGCVWVSAIVWLIVMVLQVCF